MKAIRTLIGLALALAVVSPVFAQNRTSFAGIRNAWDYAYGVNPGAPAITVASGSNGTGSYAITLNYGYTTAADGTIFYPFNSTTLSLYAPITIGSGASLETVTPTAVSCSTPQVYQTCTITATFTYSHGAGDTVRSGSYGLQEAALVAAGAAILGAPTQGLVAVDPKFFAAAGIASNSALTTFLGNYKSTSANVTVLNYGGIAGALSYSAAAGSAYASTTHVLY